MYGIEVSPALISNVTEAVMEEVKTWQCRPLEEVYPILYMDALRVKVRDGAHVVNKAIHIAMGVNLEGHKEILGLWTAQNEGAKFWLQVLTDIQNRGVKDIFIACVDGLKGFPETIETVYPKAEVELCIVHMVRGSLAYVSWKQRKGVAGGSEGDLSSATAYEAELKLDAFAKKWDGVCPMVSQTWRRNWDRITPFFAYPAEIRKVIYTTNAIESLNMSCGKSSRCGARFRTTKRRSNCCTWPCGMRPKTGPCRCKTGARLSTDLAFCGRIACQLRRRSKTKHGPARRVGHRRGKPEKRLYRDSKNEKRPEEVWAVEKWKSKIRIPTFPQPRQPAAQGRRSRRVASPKVVYTKVLTPPCQKKRKPMNTSRSSAGFPMQYSFFFRSYRLSTSCLMTQAASEGRVSHITEHLAAAVPPLFSVIYPALGRVPARVLLLRPVYAEHVSSLHAVWPGICPAIRPNHHLWAVSRA